MVKSSYHSLLNTCSAQSKTIKTQFILKQNISQPICQPIPRSLNLFLKPPFELRGKSFNTEMNYSSPDKGSRDWNEISHMNTEFGQFQKKHENLFHLIADLFECQFKTTTEKKDEERRREKKSWKYFCG